MATPGHHERSAILVTQLHRNRKVIEPEFEELRRAEVPQIVEPHVRPALRRPTKRDARCGADLAPGVVEVAIQQRPTVNGVKYKVVRSSRNRVQLSPPLVERRMRIARFRDFLSGAVTWDA